jgi:hypothetical protein
VRRNVMARRYKIILAALVLVLLIGVALFFNGPGAKISQVTGVDDGLLRKTTTTSCTTRPISLHEAEAIFKFPFPKSARKIQFAYYHKFLAYVVFLRFEAPSADCIAAVPAIIDSGAFVDIEKLPTETQKLRPASSNLDKLQNAGPLVTPWFNPDEIRIGLETGHAKSYQPKVWIDTERGIFYYQLHD